MSRGSFSSVIRFSLWGENDEQALRDHTTHHSTVISNSQKEFPHLELRPSFPCRCKYWTSSVEVTNPFTKPSCQKWPHPLFVLPKSWSSSSLRSQMVHQLYSDHLISQTCPEPRSHSFPCSEPVSIQPVLGSTEDHSLLGPLFSFFRQHGRCRLVRSEADGSRSWAEAQS